MIIPFLFTMGLCSLTHAASGCNAPSMEAIVLEEDVEISQLPNGIKIYLQESKHHSNSSAFRVVMRSACEEIVYSYDGNADVFNAIEPFFDDCCNKLVIGVEKENRSIAFPVSSPQQLAIIGVGDFSSNEILPLIERHFGNIAFTLSTSENFKPIYLDSDPSLVKISMQVSFAPMTKSIRTYGDIKEIWKFLVLQELYQQRLEACARSLDQSWIHAYPRFFYPMNGYLFVSEEKFENLLSLSLWQTHAIRTGGFSEEELFVAKRKLLKQLQYLASYATFPDPSFLASYYADMVLLGGYCFNIPVFFETSMQALEEIKSEDLSSHLSTFFAEERRTVRIVYPELRLADRMTAEQIEQMSAQVAALSCFSNVKEQQEEPDWMRKRKEDRYDDHLPTLLIANDLNEAQFHLAENVPFVHSAGHLGPIDPFYQLPLNDKEKRLIRTIFTTMAEKNIIQLALEKRTMEKKGKKVNHVHPLRFIGYIFSNPELKSCMRKIVKSSFKWDAFVDGFSRRMKEEYSNNNLYKHIPGFCQEVGANPDNISRFIDKKDWEGLVKSLL